MLEVLDYHESLPIVAESMRIKKDKEEFHVHANLHVYKFIDEDTRDVVMVIPSLETVSGYGQTESRAREMLEFQIEDYFTFLLKKSYKRIASELAALGWKQDPHRQKLFSKVFVDKDGALSEFNAAEGKVEVALATI